MLSPSPQKILGTLDGPIPLEIVPSNKGFCNTFRTNKPGSGGDQRFGGLHALRDHYFSIGTRRIAVEVYNPPKM